MSRRRSRCCGAGSWMQGWTPMPGTISWGCCASSATPPGSCPPMRPWSWSATGTSPAVGGSSSTARWGGASTSPGRWRSGSGCSRYWGSNRRRSRPTTASCCRFRCSRGGSRAPSSSSSIPWRSPPWCAAGSMRRRCSQPGSASAPRALCSCPPRGRGTAHPCGCSGSRRVSCLRPPASSRTSPSAWRRRASASRSTTTCPLSPVSWSAWAQAGCASSRPTPPSPRPSPTRSCSVTPAPCCTRRTCRMPSTGPGCCPWIPRCSTRCWGTEVLPSCSTTRSWRRWRPSFSTWCPGGGRAPTPRASPTCCASSGR